ncbi:ribulose-phosphate 3-epimerase [Roseimaritima ulvae]|uniref:Ribulose-phosphate 3-epimerase n=1 Tax=Roseimaritima ulvae TaxID=980254 RepID=A0A5B9QW20_9BACT|nr:ribulose-phosphate 3-epimerase [Roseimaritima ulvae]QEG41575.1 Ribulose-phosphate 3-epimerase [Roseimaritima ulvae]
MHQERLTKLRNASPAVLPSLLQCDFGDLRSEVERLQAAGIRALHLDVMDGHFVPNLTYGMPIVAGLRKLTDLPLDVHLMISDPAAYVDDFAAAGADMLTFHIEAVPEPAQLIQQIHSHGIVAGVALNPQTPMEALSGCLDQVDAVLVMSVNAGFGGQAFDPEAVQRLQQLRQSHPELLLEVDGGIKPETIGPCHQAGCDLFVVGSAIFGQDDYAAAVRQLRDAL